MPAYLRSAMAAASHTIPGSAGLQQRYGGAGGASVVFVYSRTDGRHGGQYG